MHPCARRKSKVCADRNGPWFYAGLAVPELVGLPRLLSRVMQGLHNVNSRPVVCAARLPQRTYDDNVFSRACYTCASATVVRLHGKYVSMRSVIGIVRDGTVLT